MKKLSEVSEEELNDEELEDDDSSSFQDDQSQAEDEVVNCTPRTHMARKMLSIPCKSFSFCLPNSLVILCLPLAGFVCLKFYTAILCALTYQH